jgi:hypothetical protein
MKTESFFIPINEATRINGRLRQVLHGNLEVHYTNNKGDVELTEVFFIPDGKKEKGADILPIFDHIPEINGYYNTMLAAAENNAKELTYERTYLNEAI